MKHFLGTALAWLMVASALRAADAPASFKVSEVSFARPEKWEWVPVQSPMRKAQLKVPNANGEAGEALFFYFGESNGGGTQANIDRWYRQFQGTKEQIKGRTEEAKAGNSKVTYVMAEGTYQSGMPGTPPTPKPGFALVGAILEDPAGHVFVRFTGPKALVEASTAEFKKMISSAKH